MHDGGAFLARIDVSFNCKRIARGNLAIRPKATMQQIPTVFPGTTAHSGQGTEVEIIREDAVVRVLLNGSPILRRPSRQPLCPSSCRNESALGTLGSLCHDINHSIYGIGSPDRR